MLDLKVVYEPITSNWYEEKNYISVMQLRPLREVLLTRLGKSIWEIVANNEVTGEDIVHRLVPDHEEETIITQLEQMLNLQLVRIKDNYLWQKEETGEPDD